MKTGGDHVSSGEWSLHSPLWNAATVQRSEPVLWVADRATSLLRARLLFEPRRIVRVRMANDMRSFPVDMGITVHGRELLVSPDRGMPFLHEAELFPEVAGECTYDHHVDGRRFIHFSEGHYFHDLQVNIDYESDAAWQGPIPEGQQEFLPRYFGGLSSRSPLRLALLGDSISVGANASGFTGVAPHQPPFGLLLAERLERIHQKTVTFGNFSKGGMTAAWGVEQASRVAEFEPDLTIIAFGMNDVTQKRSVESFRADILEIVSRIGRHSSSEFLLVAGMSSNPAWHLNEPARRADFRDALSGAVGSGIGFCDVHSVWKYLVEEKGFWSLTGNGINHPNDFSHRIYADCLEAALCPTAVKSGGIQ